MSIADLLKRRPKQLDAAEAPADDLTGMDEFDANEAARKKQVLYLSAGGAIALVLGSLRRDLRAGWRRTFGAHMRVTQLERSLRRVWLE